MVEPWVEGPQVVGHPSLGWGTPSVEAEGMHTGCVWGKAKLTLRVLDS